MELQAYQGDPAGAVTQLGAVMAEAEAAHDEIRSVHSLAYQGIALAWQGETDAARAAADAALEAVSELAELSLGPAYAALAAAALAAGDVATALNATEAARHHLSGLPAAAPMGRADSAQAALAGGI